MMAFLLAPSQQKRHHLNFRARKSENVSVLAMFVDAVMLRTLHYNSSMYMQRTTMGIRETYNVYSILPGSMLLRLFVLDWRPL